MRAKGRIGRVVYALEISMGVAPFLIGLFGCDSHQRSESREQTPLDSVAAILQFEPAGDGAVFVTKDVYGGDLQYSASLKGKIRNVSKKPMKEIYVLWAILDGRGRPLEDVIVDGSPTTAVFYDKIDYLDSKAESDFTISLDLYGSVGSSSAAIIRQCIRLGAHESGLYTREGQK